MDFRMILIIITLLQIRLQRAGVNSSSSISTDHLSNMNSTDSHQHLHRRQVISNSASDVKDEDFGNLKFVKSQTPHKDAVLLNGKNKNYHIATFDNFGQVCLFDISEKSCTGPKSFPSSNSDDMFQLGHDAKNQGLDFLINMDNFEMTEFKKWEVILNQQTSQLLEICQSYYVVRSGVDIHFKTKDHFKQMQNMQTEVLTRNLDIKWEHLKMDSYDVSNAKDCESVDVLKQFIALNKNCEPAKHQVKLDQGSDKTSSFQKGRTNTFGVGFEASVSGKIPSLISLGGKVNLKSDCSRPNSETTTKVDKILHSVSMEIQVPPNHSCSIDITSTTFTAEVPYTGQLTRQYKNNERCTTSITGIYYHQEVTLVNPCTTLTDGKKCLNKQNL